MEGHAYMWKAPPVSYLVAIAGVLLASLLCSSADAKTTAVIRPGAQWLDNHGRLIQAHGGGILRFKKTWYWFGEDRSAENDPNKRYVACYSSQDLVHWTFRKQVLALADPENLGDNFVLERPKVFYNSNSKKFVMYLHLDDKSYKLARVAIAVSDTVFGSYKYVKSFRPLGQESRDIGQFIDDDGVAYLIFESRPTMGFFIARLSDDYMNVQEEVSFIRAPLEGGAVIHYSGMYYIVGSHLTGWEPNPNVYAASASLFGPWSEMKDIAPPEANTYNSQSSMLLKVAGNTATTVIYMGDRWKPEDLQDSRYIWMPVEIGSGKLRLPEPRPWTIDVVSGVAKSLTGDTPK